MLFLLTNVNPIFIEIQFQTHSRDEKNKVNIYGANVVIFEGIMAFAHKSVIDILDMKIFVDTDSDIRLAR